MTFSGSAGPYQQRLAALGAPIRDCNPVRPTQVQRALQEMRVLPGLTVATAVAQDETVRNGFLLTLTTTYQAAAALVRISATDFTEYHAAGAFAALTRLPPRAGARRQSQKTPRPAGAAVIGVTHSALCRRSNKAPESHRTLSATGDTFPTNTREASGMEDSTMSNRDVSERLAALGARVASARREIEFLRADQDLSAEMRSQLAKYADALDNAVHLLTPMPGHGVYVGRAACA